MLRTALCVLQGAKALAHFSAETLSEPENRYDRTVSGAAINLFVQRQSSYTVSDSAKPTYGLLDYVDSCLFAVLENTSVTMQ